MMDPSREYAKLCRSCFKGGLLIKVAIIKDCTICSWKFQATGCDEPIGMKTTTVCYFCSDLLKKCQLCCCGENEPGSLRWFLVEEEGKSRSNNIALAPSTTPAYTRKWTSRIVHREHAIRHRNPFKEMAVAESSVDPSREYAKLCILCLSGRNLIKSPLVKDCTFCTRPFTVARLESTFCTRPFTMDNLESRHDEAIGMTKVCYSCCELRNVCQICAHTPEHGSLRHFLVGDDMTGPTVPLKRGRFFARCI